MFCLFDSNEQSQAITVYGRKTEIMPKKNNENIGEKYPLSVRLVILNLNCSQKSIF